MTSITARSARYCNERMAGRGQQASFALLPMDNGRYGELTITASLRRSSNRNHGIEAAARSHEGSKQLSNGFITSTRRGVTGMLDY